MGVIGDLRSLVGRAPVERPPTEIYAALVDNLYAPFASFALGAAYRRSRAELRPGGPAACG